MKVDKKTSMWSHLIIKPEKRLIEVRRRTLWLTAKRQRGEHLLHKLQNNKQILYKEHISMTCIWPYDFFFYHGKEKGIMQLQGYNQKQQFTCEELLALSFMLRSCSSAWILFEWEDMKFIYIKFLEVTWKWSPNFSNNR